MPESKKNQGSGSLNKAQAQSMMFSCKERNRLLTEMMHKLHDF